MIFVTTMPDYDVTTHYLFSYTQQLIGFAESKGIKVFDLKRPKLTRGNLSKISSKQNPRFFLFNGHGDELTLYGDKIGNEEKEEEFLVREGVNHDLLEGKLTYARSCWAASSLGKKCTEKSGCFIGYNLPFQFWIDGTYTAAPSKDKVAQLFLEPSNALVRSLLKGNSAKDAAELFCSLSKKNILHLLTNINEPGAISSIRLLWMNMECQEVLGDENMNFSK